MDWSQVDSLYITVMFLSTVWNLILTAPIHFLIQFNYIFDNLINILDSL